MKKLLFNVPSRLFFVGVFMTIPALARQENSQASQQKEEPAASHDKEAHDTTSQNDSKQPPADALGERDANESEASGTSPSKADSRLSMIKTAIK
ncbi:hypothetical protein AAULR_24821 [Lacticaseibacillus rhamnosus MTCC 5462]|nr:hypothetical protein AAULR_24821 [Lacticaseibacillus rhamnosus MTCC 5462]